MKAIFRNRIFLAFLLFPFIDFGSLNVYTSLATFFNAWKILSALIILFFFIQYGKLNALLLFTILYALVINISTLIYKGDLRTSVITGVTLVAIVLFGNLIADICPLQAFRSFSAFLLLCCLVNLIFLLILPNGFYTTDRGDRMNFLAIDNQLIVTVLPTLCMNVLYAFAKPGKPKTTFLVLSVAVCALNIFITWSATSVVGMLLFLFYLIFLFNRKPSRLVTVRSLSIFYVIAYVAIILLRLQNILSPFITKILHKDLTFTGRTGIWSNALHLIMQKPLLGYGTVSQGYYMFTPYYHTGYGPHNQILFILLQSGILGLLLFFAILFLCFRRLDRNNGLYASNVLTFTFFTFFIMMLAEVYSLPLFFLLLTFGYNIEKIGPSLKRQAIS